MPITKEILSKYKNNVFVETGSLTGEGIQVALDVGFNRVISIELSPIYYNTCKGRFKGMSYVELVLGDSAMVLKNILSKLDESVTIWLDGHYSGDNTAFGKFESPLIQELEQISNHLIKNHKILIDDMRLWKPNSHYGFDSDDIKKALLKINPLYQFNYEDGHVSNDILVATVGISNA